MWQYRNYIFNAYPWGGHLYNITILRIFFTWSCDILDGLLNVSFLYIVYVCATSDSTRYALPYQRRRYVIME